MKNLKNVFDFQLNLGVKRGKTRDRDVSLLSGNAVTEEVFTRKNADKPYTYYGNIFSVGIGSIGKELVGSEVREKYLKNNQVEIPPIVRQIPFAECNTVLVEIHRRIWKNSLPKQNIMCIACGKDITCDINLSEIEMRKDDMQAFENADDLDFLQVDLEDGIDLTELIEKFDKEGDKYPSLRNRKYNRLIFRIPLLDDAINNEKYSMDTVKFYRYMAADCLVAIQEVVDNKIVEEIPNTLFTWIGMKLFDQYMTSTDLGLVRKSFMDDIPQMPFDYKRVCPCPMQKEIPYSMEATSFFSARG